MDARYRNMPGISFYSRQKELLSHQVSVYRKISMKKSYLAYLFPLVLAACSSRPVTTVNVSGEIKGMGTDTIYIYGTDRYFDRMDTLLVKDDKFSGTFSVDTLVATRMLFSDGTEYPLYMDKGDNIKIIGSLAELSALEITGNLPNEELTAFRKEQVGEHAQAEKAEEFINTHPSSLASIYLLEKYFVQKPAPDINKIRTLSERMTGELKDRPYMSELLEQIKDMDKYTVGKSIPFFRLPNAEGKNVIRTDFKNQYILLQFWASWDEQSRSANEALRPIYKSEKKKKEKNRHIAFLGISLDVDRSAWQEAIKRDTLEWEQLCDFSGWDMELVKQLSLQTLPCNLLVSPTGRIEKKNLTAEDIKAQIEEIARREKEK